MDWVPPVSEGVSFAAQGEAAGDGCRDGGILCLTCDRIVTSARRRNRNGTAACNAIDTITAPQPSRESPRAQWTVRRGTARARRRANGARSGSDDQGDGIHAEGAGLQAGGDLERLAVLVVRDREQVERARRGMGFLVAIQHHQQLRTQAVKVVDAVVWSVVPQQGADWIARLRNVSPKLMNSLKKGLSAVNYDALATESLLNELAQVHLELMGGHIMPTVTVVDSDAAHRRSIGGGKDNATRQDKKIRAGRK